MILSLDESTVCTGYSIFNKNELIKYGILQFKSKNVLERISETLFAVENLIKEYNIEKLIIENINITLSAPTAKALMGLETGLEIIAYRKNIECISIRTTSWRKILGLSNSPKLKREEKKKETITYIENKYKIKIEKDDIADSIAIGTAYLINN